MNRLRPCPFCGAKMEEALQATEHDGCEGCKYTHKDQYEMPCLMCKQSKQDLWEGKK